MARYRQTGVAKPFKDAADALNEATRSGSMPAKPPSTTLRQVKAKTKRTPKPRRNTPRSKVIKSKTLAGTTRRRVVAKRTKVPGKRKSRKSRRSR